MQIDFHHATTYVIARDAGFNHHDADIIAYASQYVDDATCSGAVYFDNGAAYNRINSAHKMIDIRNAEELAGLLRGRAEAAEARAQAAEAASAAAPVVVAAPAVDSEELAVAQAQLKAEKARATA